MRRALSRLWPFRRRRTRPLPLPWLDGPDEDPALVRSGPPRRPLPGGAVALEVPREAHVVVADAVGRRRLAAFLARRRLRLG